MAETVLTTDARKMAAAMTNAAQTVANYTVLGQMAQDGPALMLALEQAATAAASPGSPPPGMLTDLATASGVLAAAVRYTGNYPYMAVIAANAAAVTRAADYIAAAPAPLGQPAPPPPPPPPVPETDDTCQ